MFRLAFQLGKTVSELAEITWDEFIYWQAYLGIEPPDEAENLRTAALLSQITNMAGKSLPKGKTVSPDDFLGRRKPQTPQEQIAIMRSLGRSK